MPGGVVGRERELEAAIEFLAALEAGPAVLALEGEPGIGKTTVWRAAAALAAERGHRVLATRPAEPDRRLSFAGLGDLLEAVEPSYADRLPPPQRAALDAALMRSAVAPAPEPRAVFTAALSLLRALAEETPVLVAVDDVQWLDPPSSRALLFAARRLGPSRVGLLVAARAPALGRVDELLAALDASWLRRIAVGPLTLAGTQQLLKRRLERPFLRPTLLRIHRASGGNPLFSLEIARTLGAAELRPDEPLPLPDDVRSLVRGRIRRLPRSKREALLRAAALSQPTAELLGSSVGPALESGLVQELPDGVIAFGHPLYASAVYETASREERRRVHRELAARVGDLEERSRHLAAAAGGPDEAVAAELERAAELARSRGAPEMAADLQERALELTPPRDPGAADRRALAAAEDCFHAGALARARSLLEGRIEGLDDASRARALRTLAHVRFRERSVPEAIELLRGAAEAAGDDPALRVPVELDLAFTFVSLSLDHEAAQPHARTLLAYAERLDDPAQLAEALAVGAMVRFLTGGGPDEAQLERALALEDPERRAPAEFRPSLIAGFIAFYTGRFDRARSLLYPLRERLHERGEESDLPILLGTMAWLECLAGDLPRARAFAEEAIELSELTESETMTAVSLAFAALVEAYAGRVEGCRNRLAAALEATARSGYGLAAVWSSSALGFLELSLGDAAAAHDALAPMTEFVEARGLDEPVRAPFLPDEIEALVVLGELERAERLTELLAAAGRRHDRAWALATAGRCEALILAARGDLRAALEAIEPALAAHERVPMPFELARTLLAKGQIERRAKRRRAAAASLGRAVELFEGIGMPLWAARARGELARVGGRRPDDELTETEHRVAELAAAGLTNRAVAAQLFMSPKTVEANLARAYRKLGIRSRAELGRLWAGGRRAPEPAAAPPPISRSGRS